MHPAQHSSGHTGTEHTAQDAALTNFSLMFNSHKHSAQQRTVGITETPQDARSELPCYQITVPQRGKTAAAAMRYNGSSPVASACSTCMQYILPRKPGWYMRTYQQKPHSVISKPIRHAYAVAMQ